MFTKRELFALLITILVVSLAVGFDDGSETFQWSYWLGNLFIVFLMVALSLTVQQMAHKMVARRNGFDTEFVPWGIQSFRFTPMSLMGRTKNKAFPKTITLFGKEYLVHSFPLGLVLCLFVTLISNGQLFFLAVGQYNLLLKRSSRFGRKL